MEFEPEINTEKNKKNCSSSFKSRDSNLRDQDLVDNLTPEASTDPGAGVDSGRIFFLPGVKNL